MAGVQDDNSQYVYNTLVGTRYNGIDFENKSARREDYIDSLEFYFRDGDENKNPEYQYIQGIVVNWSISEPATLGSIEGTNGKPYTLKCAPDERITLWVIRDDNSITGMYYRSNHNAGGTNIGNMRGNMTYEECGSGILAGFHGTATGEHIEQIGLIFYK